MKADEVVTQFSIYDFGISPWLILLLGFIPLLLLMWFKNIYPTTRLAALLCIPLLLSFSLLFNWVPQWLTVLIPGLQKWWWVTVFIVDCLLAIAAAVDLLLLPSLKRLTATRTMARVASLGNPHAVELSFDNNSYGTFKVRVTDDASDRLLITPPFHDVVLIPNRRVTVNHHITAYRRGAFSLRNVFAKVSSLLGLWQRLYTLPCESDMHVYPDIRQVGEYALLARTNRLALIGVRRNRRAGQDNDFERLRDYQQDDNYKHIDWRSTARRQKLTVRQFQSDQSQRVVFMLDCGRMMTNEHNGLSLLDYALNSVLMLSYVALDQGDSVGMVCFSDQIHTYVPPAGGKQQMNRILHAGFNQFPKLVQSRFDQAFLYLSTHCRRRSLVVLITNVIDEVNAQQMQSYMGNLVGAHLPLTILLRDHSVFQAADNPAPDPEVLYRSAAASQLLVWRHQVIHRMKAAGGLTLDVFPEQMTSPLINQYLEIKARHLL